MKVKIKKAPKMQVGGTPKYDPTKQPTYNASILNDKGQFWTMHKDGTYREWGEPITSKPQIVPLPNFTPIGVSNTEYSGNMSHGYGSGSLPAAPTVHPSENPRWDQSQIQRDAIEADYQRKKNGVYAYGGQLGYGLDLGRNKYTMNTTDPTSNLNKTLQPVDRASADIEAEKSEQISADFDGDGSNELLNVGGKRHSQGGTPLNVPDNAFVFSDTDKMKMGGVEVSSFGKNPDNGKKYTPAVLAKQYDVNKFKSIIDDPKSDPIQKRTAELMMENYNSKLGKLALVQEAKKGFPTGVPQIAQDYIQQFAQPTPAPQGGNIQQQTANTSPGSQMKYGGLVKFVGGGDPPVVDPYAGGSQNTPTGQSNKYNRSPEYLQKWESLIPGISKMNNKVAQSAIYDYTLKNNPEAIKSMWSTYGMTHKGLVDPTTSGIGTGGKLDQNDLTPENLSKLKSAYVDGYFGARQLDPTSLSTPPSTFTRGDYIDPGHTPSVNGNIPLPNGNINPYTNQPGTANPNNHDNIPFDYLTPDKEVLDQSILNRANLHKYMPWAAPINATTANPTFYDPSRELASNEEQQNAQMNYNSSFSGPQSGAARNSQIAGQSAVNAGNILSKYDQQNVGVANEFSNMNNQIMNQLSERKSASAENLYNGNVIANQSFDNSRMKLDEQILQAKTNAWNNRATTNAINQTNPYYYQDPSSGKLVFSGGKGINAPGGNQKSGYSLEDYKDLMTKLRGQGMNDTQAHDFAMKMILGDRERTTYKGLSQIPSQTVRSGYEGIPAQPYTLSQ